MTAPLPPHAYVPGRTARHPDGAFADLTATAQPGMSIAALAACPAWRIGWDWLQAGYGWEAHELFEAVWTVLPPNSRERALVQAAIQVANAGLKARMGQPRAVARITDLARGHLAFAGPQGAAGMGVTLERLETLLQAAANLDAE